jgi:hypothetical protein
MAGETELSRDWIVMLEAAGDGDAPGINAGEVRQLLDALDPGPSGTALHVPDRYALQLRARGSSPAEALTDVLSRWAAAVLNLGLPARQVVRTEVCTPEEFERDLEIV